MDKRNSRLRRAAKCRANIKRLQAYRLTVHRTPRHIYAQVLSCDNTRVIASASTLDVEIKNKLTFTGNIFAAEIVGQAVAQRAVIKGITKVSFDRSGFSYHGRIKALADAAREGGLQL
ncbi:MAG: 50S ribosomal protein L18 [Piscirickettsiaceae bacterium]|nr:50S ribosomal protein L18 [Piscirickettsiaceae bacterium]